MTAAELRVMLVEMLKAIILSERPFMGNAQHAALYHLTGLIEGDAGGDKLSDAVVGRVLAEMESRGTVHAARDRFSK